MLRSTQFPCCRTKCMEQSAETLVYWSTNLALVVNSHLVVDPTIQQPGFDLPQWQQSLLNRFRTVQGHCGDCRKRWREVDSDLCASGEPQTMSHIVDSYPLTKLAGGLSNLHSADDDAVAWLTNYGGSQRMHTTTTTDDISCGQFIWEVKTFLSVWVYSLEAPVRMCV